MRRLEVGGWITLLENYVSLEKVSSDAKLFQALQLVNDWLKYAELKNGALLTLDVVLIVATHQLLEWNEKRPVFFDWYAWIATILLALSMLVALASFYARTKTFGFDIEKVTGDRATNALYYGHLADMNRDDVLKRLAEYDDLAKPDRYLEDLAEQIIINSKIGRRKFVLFNCALMLTLAAALTPLGAVLFYWRFCDDRL